MPHFLDLSPQAGASGQLLQHPGLQASGTSEDTAPSCKLQDTNKHILKRVLHTGLKRQGWARS